MSEIMKEVEKKLSKEATEPYTKNIAEYLINYADKD